MKTYDERNVIKDALIKLRIETTGIASLNPTEENIQYNNTVGDALLKVLSKEYDLILEKKQQEL